MPYVDTALPFGLCSTPKIFTAVADAVEWIGRQEGVWFIIHYLDDFLVLGEPGSEECGTAVQKLLGVFERLGNPVAVDKLEELSTSLVFSGLRAGHGGIKGSATPIKVGRTAGADQAVEREEVRYEEGARVASGETRSCCAGGPPREDLMRRLFEFPTATRRVKGKVRLNSNVTSDLTCGQPSWSHGMG